MDKDSASDSVEKNAFSTSPVLPVSTHLPHLLLFVWVSSVRFRLQSIWPTHRAVWLGGGVVVAHWTCDWRARVQSQSLHCRVRPWTSRSQFNGLRLVCFNSSHIQGGPK